MLPLRGGEQRLNAVPVVAAGGAVMVDNADLDGAWIAREVIPRMTDPKRLDDMARCASVAGLRDADRVLAEQVLGIVEQRRHTGGGAA